MLIKADEYLEDVVSKYITIKQGFDKGGETRWEQTAPKLPNHARLAFKIGVAKDTLYEWIKPHEGDDKKMKELRASFSYCLSRVKNLQEAMLNEQGAAGVFNPAVTNRILAAHHGYRDLQSVDHTSKGEKLEGAFGIHDDLTKRYEEELKEKLKNDEPITDARESVDSRVHPKEQTKD